MRAGKCVCTENRAGLLLFLTNNYFTPGNTGWWRHKISMCQQTAGKNNTNVNMDVNNAGFKLFMRNVQTHVHTNIKRTEYTHMAYNGIMCTYTHIEDTHTGI